MGKGKSISFLVYTQIEKIKNKMVDAFINERKMLFLYLCLGNPTWIQLQKIEETVWWEI